MNHALRQALGLDRMLREFAADITEIEAFLRGIEDYKAQTRFYWFTVVGGAAFAGFTIFKQAASALKAWKPEFDLNEVWSLLFGLVIFVAAALLISQRRPSSHRDEHEDPTKHVLLEQMIGLAEEGSRPIQQ